MKYLISTVLWLLYDILFLRNDVNLPSKSRYHNKQSTWCLEGHWRKEPNEPNPEAVQIRIRDSLVRGADPDPYQNAADPEHCRDLSLSLVTKSQVVLDTEITYLLDKIINYQNYQLSFPCVVQGCTWCWGWAPSWPSSGSWAAAAPGGSPPGCWARCV